MMQRERGPKRRRGMILIITAAALTVLLGIGALAVDGAYLLQVKAELQSASDAVALAAASGLTVGQGEAQLRAQQYGQLNPILGQPVTVNPASLTFGRWDFTTNVLQPVTAQPNSVRIELGLSDAGVSPALFLAPALGINTNDVGATATATLGSRSIMVVLDRSESMKYDGLNPEQPLTDTKTAAKGFLDLIQNFPIDGDRVGLVFYNHTATVDHQLTEVFGPVQTAIDQPNALGLTNIAAGLCEAREELRSGRAGSRGLKVVVLLSDGRTNTRINPATCAGGPQGQDRLAGPGNPSEQQALAQADLLRGDGAILYTISLGNSTNQTLMNNMAVVTGGEHFFAPTTAQLDDIFEEISARIPVILVE